MKIRPLLLLFLCLPGLLEAGSLQLLRDRDTYTLNANQVLLSDILEEVDRQETASLQFFGDHTQLISATYHSVTLDELLYKLGVSYVLVYEADENGEYRLGDAVMLDSNAMGIDQATAIKIRKLVRDLENDDIPHNALAARHELSELGCAAVPFLEEALSHQDFQARQTAADLLRHSCPEYKPSDKLIEVTFELLNADDLDYNHTYLMSSGGAFNYLNETSVYPRVRNRLLNNLQSRNPRERLYSALLAAEHGETSYANTLARIMIPHLADNDLSNDAAASAFALYQLGPSVLPHLQPYRNSTDPQQAELVELICSALEGEDVSAFNPVMYASYSKLPIQDQSWINVLRWDNENFPDETGKYPHLEQPRMTAADCYGTNDGAAPFHYTTQSGDTLTTIAEKFMVPASALMELNPDLKNGEIIQLETLLFIPVQ